MFEDFARRLRLKHCLMRFPPILAALCLLASSAGAQEIALGSVVCLTRDTPLFFNGNTVVRQGRRGERFVLIALKPNEKRAYVSGRNLLGQAIALNLEDDAIMPANLPTSKVFGDRIAAELRVRAMTEHGGKPASEEAVVRGLQYLAGAQMPDGSWGQGSKPYVSAMTGLSLLSLLGHGETPDSPEFGPTVKNAVRWIMSEGALSEGRLSMEPAFTSSGVYAHAIVAFALAEYYAMTRDATVVDMLKKAVMYMVEGQGPDRGWMYTYDRSQSDTSVSGWHIQALLAVHRTELNLDQVDAALDKAMLNLKRVRGPKGGFGYRSLEDRYSLTGVGAYCMHAWNPLDGKTVTDGVRFVLDETRKNYPVKYLDERADLYTWYYNTLACASLGGPSWATWNRLFQEEIAKNQKSDGSWPELKGHSPAGELQRDPGGCGPVYRTSLCILMLEVYYRYGSSGGK